MPTAYLINKIKQNRLNKLNRSKKKNLTQALSMKLFRFDLYDMTINNNLQNSEVLTCLCSHTQEKEERSVFLHRQWGHCYLRKKKKNQRTSFTHFFFLEG